MSTSPKPSRNYLIRFQIRIGLHFGQVVAGKLGSPGNKKMKIIGDTVNFASRVQAANRQAGTQFLISEDTLCFGESAGSGRPVRPSSPTW